ncbi:hypothetical protein PAHAL_9G328100 [Panicum hallii]|uniref:Uncharacterized protein n=1 Tax=Panicum hallii TaxID=206008 RepID=A0A2T8I390_9POAL|nr:hypothetical protein PAHAL_9G328100 [Panicum hallii]
MHFGTSLPMGQLPLRSFPLRSGSSSSARHRLPAVRRSPKSVVVAPGGQPPRDDAAILVDAGCSTLVDVRTFDPMINESEDYPTRLRLRNLEVGDGLPARHDVLLSNPLEDPMLLELELLSAPSSPATGMDEGSPPQVLNATAPRRWSRQQQQAFSIRRSERLAKKTQNVMMKKLGVTTDSRPPDASSFQQFKDTFSSTLILSHCEALDALLPSGMGSMATEVVAPVMVS